MIDKNLNYAVVGASADRSKYGYQVFKDLLDNGYKVKPVNPKKTKILDQLAYASLADIIPKPDVAIFVVPPNITLQILDDVKKLKINLVWFQPGSESEAAIKFCRDMHIEYVANACIMIKRLAKN